MSILYRHKQKAIKEAIQYTKQSRKPKVVRITQGHREPIDGVDANKVAMEILKQLPTHE